MARAFQWEEKYHAKFDAGAVVFSIARSCGSGLCPHAGQGRSGRPLLAPLLALVRSDLPPLLSPPVLLCGSTASVVRLSAVQWQHILLRLWTGARLSGRRNC